jgi:hypothetical protein
VVEDNETDTAVKGHKQEQACEVMVYDTTISVGKGTKTRILAIDLSSFSQFISEGTQVLMGSQCR